jgi:hypothetical protein
MNSIKEKQVKIKKIRNTPQTLNDRLKNIFTDKNQEIPFTLEEKRDLGSLIVKKFFESEMKYKHVKRVEIEEDGEKMQVLQYPSFFVPVMDAIIHQAKNSKNAKTEVLSGGQG